METEPQKKRTGYKKASPISEQAYLELHTKYGVPVDELRTMARDLKMARPRLEMHLIYLSVEAKTKTR